MKMGSKLLGLAVVAMVVVSTSAAMAQRGPGQGRGGRGFGGGGFGGGGNLLGMEQVQKELDLSDDQKEAIQKLSDEARAEAQKAFEGFRDLSEDERAKRGEEMRKNAEALSKKINDVLLPNQRERLSELRVQSQARFGLASALVSPEVADKLKLTDEQKEKLQALAPRFGGFGRGGRGGERGEGNNNQDAPRLTREERDAKAKEVLTADQLAQFEKMQGKKFEFPQMGRGGRGGQGGGGQGGGERRRRGQPDA